MADLSKIKLNNVTYNFKDSFAREQLPLVIECSSSFEDEPYYALDISFDDLYEALNNNINNIILKYDDDESDIHVRGYLLSYSTFFDSMRELNAIHTCFFMSSISSMESIMTIATGDFTENDNDLILYVYDQMAGLYEDLNDVVYKEFLPNFIGNTGWDDSSFNITIVIDNVEEHDSLNNFLIQVIPEEQDLTNTWPFITKDMTGSTGERYFNKSNIQLYDEFNNLISNPTTITQGLYSVQKTGTTNDNIIFTIKPYITSETAQDILTYIDNTIANLPTATLATETTNGLLSADDKKILNGLNPNIEKTISNLNASEFNVINAKQEDALGLVMAVEPTVSQQIRTSNLLDVSVYTPGFYIGSNGQLSNNANDHVGDFIPVSPGDDIYYTGIIGPTNSSSINRRLHVYKADKTWIKQISFAGSLRVGDSWSTHGVVPTNGAYIRVSWGVEDTNVMITVGAPDKYYPYYMTPFTATSSVSFKIGHTSDPEDATTYTFNVPAAAGDLYGLQFDPIKGKVWKVTEHIASYNGETLPGHWLSDRDTYLEGTTPQIGAEVVYRLDDEDIVEYDCIPMTIPLSEYENYFFIENGMFMELSYYAATIAIDHLTIYSGATFGDTNILETDVIGWNRAAELIDTKADLVGAQLTGTVTAPTLSITANSDRIATTAFVQSMLHTLAPFEATTKASKNYEVGEYLTYAGNLYKVTATIAKNANLTVGTNIEVTDAMNEMGSQSDVFIVHTSNSTWSSSYYYWSGSTDKSFNEIFTAYNNGKIIIAIDDNGAVYTLNSATNYRLVFLRINEIKRQPSERYVDETGDNVDLAIQYNMITIVSSSPNIARRDQITVSTESECLEYITILDANGDIFRNADDLTTANANSLSVDMLEPFVTSSDMKTFYAQTKVIVGFKSQSWDWDGSPPISYEIYDFVKYNISREMYYNTETGYDETRDCHIGTFKTLSERNGIPVIKTITITCKMNDTSGESEFNPQATYSEVALSS